MLSMRLLLVMLAVAALPARDPSVRRVDIRTFQFAPDTVKVTVGTKVTWNNRDEIEHTVTTGTPDGRDGTLDAVLRMKGDSASRTFERAGTWTYFCDRHPFMRGVITVTR